LVVTNGLIEELKFTGDVAPLQDARAYSKDASMNFPINLTSAAVILWSGMLIIAGSIWVLASQVRKLADLVERQSKLDQQKSRDGRRAIGRSTDELPRDRVLRMVERTTSKAN
jgi:hypothetical protein